MELIEYMKASKMLEKYGIKSIRSSYVPSSLEAVKFAGANSIVLKLLSDKALHKSKAGLVKVGLLGKKDIESAFRELERKGASLKPYKIIAQEMAKGGIEIIIGGNIDQQFGKMVLLGLGGGYVETFKDTALRICPIGKSDAEDMLNQLKSKDVITSNGSNSKMVVDLVLQVSRFFSESDISELDLNPVMIRKDGYDVVDIRMLE